jgi:hypothetical protein
MRIADAAGRYVQLTWQGRELRGECPGCGLPSLCVDPARERWRCFSCGAHDTGDPVEAFIRLARECGLQEGELREPLRPALRSMPRWERVRPPQGSYPELAPPWLGTPLRVEEERDEHGRHSGYRATYPRMGSMRWIYVRYAAHDPGHWKVRRPPMRERLALRFPAIPGEVAQRVQGRSRVSVSEFLLDGEKRSGHKAQAIAHAIRALGWQHKREGTGRRQRYYVRATMRAREGTAP